MINSRFTLRCRYAVLVAAFAIAACTPNDPESRLERARAEYAGGTYRVAIIELRNVLQEQPDNSEALMLLGRTSYAIGDFAGAVTQYERARSAGAVLDADMQIEYAEALAQAGRYEDALAALDELDVDGVTGRSRLARAEVLAADGQYEAAETLFREALGDAATAYAATVGLARSAAAQESWGVAYERATRAIALDEGRWEAHRIRGLVRMQTGDAAGAAVDLATAAERLATGPETTIEIENLLVLSELQLTLGDESALARTAALAAERAPGSDVASYIGGASDFLAGRYPEANSQLLDAVAASPENLRAILLLGATNLELGNLGQAEQHLRNVVNARPDDRLANRYLVETLRRQGRLDDAINRLESIPAADNDLAIVALRAELQLEAGRAGEAARLLEQIVAVAPDQVAVRLQLARAYVRDGRRNQALELFGVSDSTPVEAALDTALGLLSDLSVNDAEQREQAVQNALAAVDASSSDVPRLIGTVLFLAVIGEQERALDMLGDAPTSDPAFDEATLMLAGITLAQGDPERADAIYQSIVERDPSSFRAWLGLARVASARGSTEQAIQFASEAAAAAPEAVEPQVRLAQLQLARGDIDAAESAAEAALRIDDGESAALTIRGAIRISRGELARAEADLARAFAAAPAYETAALLHEARRQGAFPNPDAPLAEWLAISPRDARAASLLASYYQGTGQADRAIALYERVLQVNPSHLVALNNLAWLYNENGDSRALMLARRAHEQAPDSAAVLDTYAWVLLHNEPLANDALPLLRRAAELDPEDGDIRYHLAYALVENGLMDEARATLEDLLDSGVEFTQRDAAEALLASI